eukprot:5105782-Alexandrium_andersonii.AAC.1
MQTSASSGSPEPSTGPFCRIDRADSESNGDIGTRAPRNPGSTPLIICFVRLSSGGGWECPGDPPERA